MLHRLFIRGLFKKCTDCLNCATRVGFSRIRLVSLGSYRSTDLNAVFGRRYLHLLISYTVLCKECFFRLSDCKMDSLKMQRIAVKFYVKLGKSTTEIFAMLNTAYGDVVMNCTACFK